MEARDAAGDLKRSALTRVAPWARSVIVCAINYNTTHPYSTQYTRPENASRGWISRYAWSREDYHDSILRRLKQVEDELRGLLEATGCWAPGTGHSRSYVDTGPLVERVYAKYAGIGWIGKNTCIINQKLGSWLFLGVILASLDFAGDNQNDKPTADRYARARSLRDLHPLHRGLPDSSNHRARRIRCSSVYLLPDHRKARRDSERTCALAWAATSSVATFARMSVPGIAKPP